MTKTIRGVFGLSLIAVSLAGCSPFPPDLVGDPLPSVVDLPWLPKGAHVDYVTEVGGASYYLVDEGEPTMCIVHYASDDDWTAGCGGPSIRMTNSGRTVAWFEDGAPAGGWSELGGGLWIKS